MNLLVLNLAMDERDPVLAFCAQWVVALAGRVCHVDVVTMRLGESCVPDNVKIHSLGKERGYTEVRRGLRFYRLLSRIVAERRIHGCFAHMTPLFAVMAAPLLRSARIPLVTWYAHPRLTTKLKLAHMASTRIVTSVPHAYPYKRDKLIVLGQGIDTHLFAAGPAEVIEPGLVLSVGRIAPIKRLGTLLRAAALLREAPTGPPRVVLVGDSLGRTGQGYRAQLGELARELGSASRVEFAGPVRRSELPHWYWRCAAHVSLTPCGSGDKTALEAMSCARPSLFANADFDAAAGAFAPLLRFRADDAQDLAAKLKTVLSMPRQELSSLGVALRQGVLRLHGLDSLSRRLCDLFESLADSKLMVSSVV